MHTLSDDRRKKPTPNLSTSATHRPNKAATFPPTRWDNNVVSKTRPPATVPPVDRLELGNAEPEQGQPPPPRELEARKFLGDRFRAAGYSLESDYHLHAPGIAVVLDGFDPIRRTGFVYISHDDADVVSDIGHAEELAFKQMFDTGDAYILVLHDRDIDALSTLEHRLDDFLAEVHRRTK